MLRNLIASFLLKLEAATNQHGLGIPAILGRPETGRAEPALPLCAVLLAQDGPMLAGGEGRAIPRLGALPAASGRTIMVNLYLYANGEPELFDLVDLLHHSRRYITSVTVSGQTFAVRYGVLERLPESEDPLERFATITPVTFSTVSEG